jgi:predicted enzyme related to lactoylglutathione lyase
MGPLTGNALVTDLTGGVEPGGNRQDHNYDIWKRHHRHMNAGSKPGLDSEQDKLSFEKHTLGPPAATWQDRGRQAPEQGRGRMRVTRIGWAGTRTSEYSAMVAFLQTVLGLTTSQEASDFAAFQLPEGGTFEVFGPGDQDHEHFSTGPVVGFVVEDLTAAVRELEAAGVELLGGQIDERGGGWRHFRAPDGNVYELTSG